MDKKMVDKILKKSYVNYFIRFGNNFIKIVRKHQSLRSHGH